MFSKAFLANNVTVIIWIKTFLLLVIAEYSWWLNLIRNLLVWGDCSWPNIFLMSCTSASLFPIWCSNSSEPFSCGKRLRLNHSQMHLTTRNFWFVYLLMFPVPFWSMWPAMWHHAHRYCGFCGKQAWFCHCSTTLLCGRVLATSVWHSKSLVLICFWCRLSPCTGLYETRHVDMSLVFILTHL